MRKILSFPIQAKANCFINRYCACESHLTDLLNPFSGGKSWARLLMHPHQIWSWHKTRIYLMFSSLPVTFLISHGGDGSTEMHHAGEWRFCFCLCHPPYPEQKERKVFVTAWRNAFLNGLRHVPFCHFFASQNKNEVPSFSPQSSTIQISALKYLKFKWWRAEEELPIWRKR